MSKILFSDLDGTLLRDDKTISDANREAIQEMLNKGHYFVICTGRPVASGRIVARELCLTSPGCYMVCFNGSVIYDIASDRVLAKQSLPYHLVEKLFQNAQDAGIHIQTYNETDIISLKHTDELDYYMERTNMSYKVVDNLFDSLMNEPQKVLLIDTEHSGKLQEFEAGNLEWTQNGMSTVYSCEEFLEYVPKNINKGTGVKYLADFLNIPLEDTIAVGDERNDIPMIQAAHIGVAMKNAHEDVKEAADIVTLSDNNQDAIAKIIHKYILEESED